MNIKSLVYMVLFTFSPFIQGVDESVKAAITASDIQSLKGLLMPGAYVRLQDKKIYSSLAQQKTKEAYMNLTAFGFADIKHGIMFLAKAGATAFFAHEFYNRMMEVKNYSKDATERNTNLWDLVKVDVVPQVVAAPTDALTVLGQIMKDNWQTFSYSVVAAYFAAKSYDDACGIVNKDDRYARYIHALAVESLVARVPVFEQ